MNGLHESLPAPVAKDDRGERAHSALVTAALVALLVVSVGVAVVLGLFGLMAMRESSAAAPNWSGYLGFSFVYGILLLGAAEAAAAAGLTLLHRRKAPGSLPSRSEYARLAESVAIAVGGAGVLLCVGGIVGMVVGSTLLPQIIAFAVAAVVALVWFVNRRRGRVTTLRTRSFGVIVVAMVIPCLVLAALGVSGYLLSWNTASAVYYDQAAYGARVLNSDVGSLHKVPGGLSAAAQARLSREIVRAFAHENRNGALRSTIGVVKTEHVLPRWAIRSLKRRGFALGMMNGSTMKGRAPDVIAWRVGPQDVRYFRSDYINGPAWVDPPHPYQYLGRLASAAVAGVVLVLALGLLGAWLLSRSVVRPVRRLAEASGRLAEGEAGVTVTPSGPRELRDLAVSFNDMNAKLAKAKETEQAFLLSVSHELKTPLTSIRGYAEGVGDGTIQPSDGAEVIGAESSRLERLVGDLLESGRMRKSEFAVRREAVDLAAVAEDVARRYEATARDAGLTLLLNAEAGGGAVADHDRVLQVVSNLVENAIRCTPAPGSVTISTAPGTISVSDTGRGLTSDDLPRAFERFYLYSRYGTDRPVGTGLGLAIVKELTEAMDGSVEVSSAVGVGTAFTVRLPASDVPRDASAAPPPAAQDANRPATQDASPPPAAQDANRPPVVQDASPPPAQDDVS